MSPASLVGCNPVRAHSRPSPYVRIRGRASSSRSSCTKAAVAYVAVQRGGGRPLLKAENRVVEFAKSGVTAL